MLAVLGLIVWLRHARAGSGIGGESQWMFMRLGFVFPHAMTEDSDIAKKDARAKKQ